MCVCLFFVFWGDPCFHSSNGLFLFFFFFFYLILKFSPLANTHTHIHTRKRKKSTFEQMTQRELEKKKPTYLPTLIFFPCHRKQRTGRGNWECKGWRGRKQCPKKSQSISFCFEEMSFYPSSFALECELSACVFFLFCQILLTTNNNKIWY